PEISRTQSNKVWFIPTEFTAALSSIAKGFGGGGDGDGPDLSSGRPPGVSPVKREDLGPSALTDPAQALAEARRESQAATSEATTATTPTARAAARAAQPTPSSDESMTPRSFDPRPQDGPPPPPES
ncbi:MAG: SPFH/Band 7/PHB domain protein, partial [Actinotalea sp.]|nr:SPFH/Band 7/PHB domain protein [Actinotalea sp.]